MKNYSWGNYPPLNQKMITPHWRNQVADCLSNLPSYLPYGNGRSYGDSCLAKDGFLVSSCNLSRFIGADWTKGIIEAESGVTLKDIIDVALPHGWFLPVTPGTQYVTLGGAVANDVHGKNHHTAGTFGCHILALTIVRSDGSVVISSPENNFDLFSATIGGLGLTGFISKITLKLKRVRSSYIEQKTIKFSSLKEFFSLSAAYDKQHEYSVSWIDCLSGENTRGHYIVGDHCDDMEFDWKAKKKINFPVTPPFSLVNNLSLKPFNSIYYSKQFHKEVVKKIDFESFFYPLDSITNWNKMYGKNGFQQYQCVIPFDNGYEVLTNILAAIKKSNVGSFLAVLKVFGGIKSPGLLSFPRPGITIALDFPCRTKINRSLFTILDSIINEASGRLYPAKDSHMSSDAFKNSYPNWVAMEKLKDKNVNSHFWKRVTA